jgi:uncharacterized protein
MTPQDWAAALSGGLVGFILAVVGGGGSILATPLLLYAVGIPSPHIAIGTSAVAVSANAFANLIGHARQGNVRWPCAAVFATAGLIGVVAGKQLAGNRLVLQRMFAIVIFAAAGYVLYRSLWA